jgi:hypothetical protein
VSTAWLTVAAGTLCALGAAICLGQAGVLLETGPPEAPASRPASAPAPATPAEFGPYAPLVNALALVDPQRAEVRTRYADQRKAQAAFLEEHRGAWAEAMRQAASADADEAAAGKAAVQQLQRQYDALTAAGQCKVMAALTKAQALTWERRTLEGEALSKLTPLRIIGHGPGGQLVASRTPLSGAQLKILREHCAQAAERLQALANPYEPDARRKAIDELVAKTQQALQQAGIPLAGPGEPEQ